MRGEGANQEEGRGEGSWESVEVTSRWVDGVVYRQYIYPSFGPRDKAIIESDDVQLWQHSSVSIVVSIPACHVGDLGSIPRRSG